MVCEVRRLSRLSSAGQDELVYVGMGRREDDELQQRQGVGVGGVGGGRDAMVGCPARQDIEALRGEATTDQHRQAAPARADDPRLHWCMPNPHRSPPRLRVRAAEDRHLNHLTSHGDFASALHCAALTARLARAPRRLPFPCRQHALARGLDAPVAVRSDI
jgi:hypothetical protein